MRIHSKRLIGALSGEYRQRVGIAQAIVHGPKLVVMDEPTNGLDPNQTLVMRELIREIAGNCAVLISTHILPDVEALCDDIKMIEQGKIVFDGSLEEFSGKTKSSSLTMVLKVPPAEREFPKPAGCSGAGVLERKYRAPRGRSPYVRRGGIIHNMRLQRLGVA